MPWLDKVKAVIVQFLPGEQAGVALAATLFGDAVSGRHDQGRIERYQQQQQRSELKRDMC
jgi:hypothetical protein